MSGATFKRLRMVGVSGKAMQDTVPPAGTACQEAMRGVESEGHKSVRPLLDRERSICRTKVRNLVIRITALRKARVSRHLRWFLLADVHSASAIGAGM